MYETSAGAAVLTGAAVVTGADVATGFLPSVASPPPPPPQPASPIPSATTSAQQPARRRTRPGDYRPGRAIQRRGTAPGGREAGTASGFRCCAPWPGAAVIEGTAALARQEPRFAPIVDALGPADLRRGRPRRTHFAELARAICYQQLAGAAARTIHGRFEAPSAARRRPRACSRSHRRPCGPRASRRQGGVDPRPRREGGVGRRGARPRRRASPTTRSCAQLTLVRGIGRWTAEMFLMFQLGRLDVWPVDDLGVRKGYARHLRPAGAAGGEGARAARRPVPPVPLGRGVVLLARRRHSVSDARLLARQLRRASPPRARRTAAARDGRGARRRGRIVDRPRLELRRGRRARTASRTAGRARRPCARGRRGTRSAPGRRRRTRPRPRACSRQRRCSPTSSIAYCATSHAACAPSSPTKLRPATPRSRRGSSQSRSAAPATLGIVLRRHREQLGAQGSSVLRADGDEALITYEVRTVPTRESRVAGYRPLP